MPYPVATISDVSKSYSLGAARVPALRHLSLDIFAGELLAVAGPSGSGKTTLLNLVGCLDQPDAGSIEIEGIRVSDLAGGALTRVRRDRLGYVFQTFNLVPVLTARENVEYPLLLKGVPAGERRRKAVALLDRVGLAGKTNRRPDALSGGERQRVAIARALANDPVLVLADEPTASLDSATGAAVLDLMRDLRDGSGTTFLFASHDPRLLDRMDRVVSMRDGEIVAQTANNASHAAIAV